MIDGLHSNGSLAGIFARWYVYDTEIFYGRPALFLDRDGVIVEDTHYLSDISQVSFLPGAVEALKILRESGIPVVVVTNQAGIGRGYYGWQDFMAVQDYINDYVREGGGFIAACAACPYHPEGQTPYCHKNHPFRKPNPGMLLWARESAHIDLGKSWIVGDKLSDLQSGALAGLAGLVHVATGHGKNELESVERWSRHRNGVIFAANLKEAVEKIFRYLS